MPGGGGGGREGAEQVFARLKGGEGGGRVVVRQKYLRREALAIRVCVGGGGVGQILLCREGYRVGRGGGGCSKRDRQYNFPILQAPPPSL